MNKLIGQGKVKSQFRLSRTLKGDFKINSCKRDTYIELWNTLQTLNGLPKDLFY